MKLTTNLQDTSLIAALDKIMAEKRSFVLISAGYSNTNVEVLHNYGTDIKLPTPLLIRAISKFAPEQMELLASAGELLKEAVQIAPITSHSNLHKADDLSSKDVKISTGRPSGEVTIKVNADLGEAINEVEKFRTVVQNALVEATKLEGAVHSPELSEAIRKAKEIAVSVGAASLNENPAHFAFAAGSLCEAVLRIPNQ